MVASNIAFLFDVNKGLYYALAHKQRKGIDVKIVLNGVSQEALRYNTATVEFLKSIGVRDVKLTSRFTHIKLYIVDNHFIVDYHNLTSSPIANRFELSMTVKSRSLADPLDVLFEHLYREEESK